jgi:uncharacterized protein (DUF1501 family)
VPITTLKSIADFHLQGDSSRLDDLRQRLESLYRLGSSLDADAAETFNAEELLGKIDIANYSPSAGAEYPDTEFGMAMKQVAQIAKAEIGLEVACVDIGGWDTHNQEGGLDGELPTLLAEFSSGLASLYHDLGDRAKRVTVVTMSEFGRRVKENGSSGTDHGHGNCMFVLGGGVNGGKVYGEWPGLTPEKLYGPGDLDIKTDYRDVLGEVVQRRLKNPGLTEIFPNYTDWKNLDVVQG